MPVAARLTLDAWRLVSVVARLVVGYLVVAVDVAVDVVTVMEALFVVVRVAEVLLGGVALLAALELGVEDAVVVEVLSVARLLDALGPDAPVARLAPRLAAGSVHLDRIVVRSYRSLCSTADRTRPVSPSLGRPHRRTMTATLTSNRWSAGGRGLLLLFCLRSSGGVPDRERRSN